MLLSMHIMVVIFFLNFDQNCPHDWTNSGVLCTSKQRSDQRRQPLCFWSSEAHDSGRKIKIINWRKKHGLSTKVIFRKTSNYCNRTQQTIVIKKLYYCNRKHCTIIIENIWKFWFKTLYYSNRKHCVIVIENIVIL